MRFKNKIVIDTGAGAGIGAATALRFCEEGAFVVCNSVSNSAKAVTEQLTQKGFKSIFIQGDIADPETASHIINKTLEQFGRLDILINNAGIVLGGTIDNTSLADFHRTLDVNVIGTFLMSQKAVEVMKKQGKGTIVNVSSVAASKGHINRLAYSASKGAVTAMTRSMALELCHDNIRVNCVSPGTTLTPSLESRIAHSPDPEEAQKQFCARQPINTLGTPKEIAEAILFAADDAASYMIGANIAIDGGVTM